MSDPPVILYIEDNDDNRKLVSRVLTAEGFAVEGVADGPAGLDYVADHAPDLILVDINLPQVDGYTITRRLKEIPHLNGVPVIALTANVMKGAREKTLAAGCDGYISKPISVDRLPEQVRGFLPEQ